MRTSDGASFSARHEMEGVGTKYAVAMKGATPARRVNGGLYTGREFAGRWGNVSRVPETIEMAYASGVLPEARSHVPSQPRVGNNHVDELPNTEFFPDINVSAVKQT